LELLSVRAVVDPFPRRDTFVGGNYRSVGDDRYEITVAARLCSHNAELVLGIMEGNPFDKARQHFLALGCRLWLHESKPKFLAMLCADPAHPGAAWI
jgi:hypothetical protein